MRLCKVYCNIFCGEQNMNDINQKIIDAIIAKAEKICPNSLALIGVYGSFATGDIYKKSDLDLLILIQDDDGWKLGTGFILNDIGVGYDIYCTNWDGLKYDSECHHAHISKLLDSKIVYVKNQSAYQQLCKLREDTKSFLESDKRFERVTELISKAKVAFSNSHLTDEIGKVRLFSAEVMNFLLDAIMLYHGTYFKRGVKRTFEELSNLSVEKDFINNLKQISESKDIHEIRALLKNLILYVENHTKQENKKEEPTANLAGTYEEMYSNWRNKVEEAVKSSNSFSSFMSMCNLQYFFLDISSGVNIGEFNIMDEYNPDNLEENVKIYDKYLNQYEQVYKNVGINVKRYSNVDEFVKKYLEDK